MLVRSLIALVGAVTLLTGCPGSVETKTAEPASDAAAAAAPAPAPAQAAPIEAAPVVDAPPAQPAPAAAPAPAAEQQPAADASKVPQPL